MADIQTGPYARLVHQHLHCRMQYTGGENEAMTCGLPIPEPYDDADFRACHIAEALHAAISDTDDMAGRWAAHAKIVETERDQAAAQVDNLIQQLSQMREEVRTMGRILAAAGTAQMSQTSTTHHDTGRNN